MNPLKGKNLVSITGTVTQKPEFERETHGINIYKAEITVKRTSGNTDVLALVFPEKLLDDSLLVEGQKIQVTGHYRSVNIVTEEKSKVVLHVYAKEIIATDKEDNNFVLLNGYICKEPIYRTTPLGKEICEFILAVNRPLSDTDYIPCIVWGSEAKKASEYKVGDNIELYGRIQSREYVKTVNDNKETRVAYEVSARRTKKMTTPKTIS